MKNGCLVGVVRIILCIVLIIVGIDFIDKGKEQKKKYDNLAHQAAYYLEHGEKDNDTGKKDKIIGWVLIVMGVGIGASAFSDDNLKNTNGNNNNGNNSNPPVPPAQYPQQPPMQ